MIKYVAIEDAASNLGILESDLRSLLRPLSPIGDSDHRGRPTVPTSYIEKISSDDSYLNAVGRAIAAQSEARAEDAASDSVFRQGRLQLLTQYGVWIDELQAVHQRYLDAANNAGPESSGLASYLLLSRAISTLKALHTCLKEGHWYSGSLLRDIDECLDLAHYFVITEGTENGECARRKWFRENITPKHEELRKAISKYTSALLGDMDSTNHLALMRELYGKKSKWTHPTYASIREITEYVVGGDLSVAAVDYGPCRYERKLFELTEFFRSSIWTTFQTLWLCFDYRLTLSVDDRAFLHRYDLMFQELADGL